ncbi:hypothetical protein D3C77_789250 [compost metagenome]
METTSRKMTRASFIAGFFRVLGFRDALAAPYGFIDDGNEEYKCADRHGDLGYP